MGDPCTGRGSRLSPLRASHGAHRRRRKPTATFISQLWRNTGTGFTDVTAEVARDLGVGDHVRLGRGEHVALGDAAVAAADAVAELKAEPVFGDASGTGWWSPG